MRDAYYGMGEEKNVHSIVTKGGVCGEGVTVWLYCCKVQEMLQMMYECCQSDVFVFYVSDVIYICYDV